MLVSEIMGDRARDAPIRFVGVRFDPGDYHQLMLSAVDLYRNLGVDVEIVDGMLRVRVGPALADYVMGLLERRTGRIGFNEWWD